MNEDVCENGATCVSLTEEDGNYRCLCAEGFTGRNCEVATQVEQAVVSPTAPPTSSAATPTITSTPSPSSSEVRKEILANVTQNEAI
jgi:hypothetical protein